VASAITACDRHDIEISRIAA